ncbi:hypothetical protein PSN45_000942 [Yamadazyma tenuis]|uniref:Uncharacterized protein n=1 Tax=Candida tenuis (strain ATCC 10573 / BCRC 21748 / CBS 615 / JCM 9827 / NBRC 10315 / NRRL Y-1498 / VKM Y-70) TaxID=590646 RepID=G3BBR5_CANTC|nr:uncharacterized protein CANTEDRAFT_115684 [Yamadazyma tenuis ATCC 10573]XP_006688991.1 uncharacterized protein CANTEDRAFT_115684 [Yamadazyma tenuis ATCC 10573]EGV62820.1 hypothetical protein CANTEDRAFT_115684 [Yamadazyma tenuis ATCC 10573]EGV62821.1 hypothetical protein CANTEDRAFT_115684 [Yamadazyma tenuis ATCC 10573]WEJ93478.1 hypothetical protein PSN45_000942 [Yamadazyma tenuis]
MSDGMTSFELQQEVDKILSRAHAIADSTDESAVDSVVEAKLSPDINNSQNENDPHPQPKQIPTTKKPIRFKVRKVSGDDKEREVTTADNKTKHMKSVQLQYDQCVNRIEKIKKEVNFLKTLLPPYNVEIDYHTRTKIERAIEKLNMKSDELAKKKYGLGINLSRLWREFDDSQIWIRSVSN